MSSLMIHIFFFHSQFYCEIREFWLKYYIDETETEFDKIFDERNIYVL